MRIDVVAACAGWNPGPVTDFGFGFAVGAADSDDVDFGVADFGVAGFDAADGYPNSGSAVYVVADEDHFEDH